MLDIKQISFYDQKVIEELIQINKLMGMKKDENIRFLYVDKEKLIFHFMNNRQIQDEIVLNAGYQLVASTYFKHDIPTEAETEYAINFIEDELMSYKQLVCNNEELIIKSQVVEDVFKKNNINQKVILRQEIEDLFSEFARVILRKYTAGSNIEIDSLSFTVILLLREITHHLKFNQISL